MRERRSFWGWFWSLFNLRVHFFVIDEMERSGEVGARKSSKAYFWYKRFFWHFYRVTSVQKGGLWIEDEKDVWSCHIEIPIRRHIRDDLFAFRFHIGNRGSETPWDGHLTILGISWYWGHSGFRRLADRLTRCSGYKYDTRNWMLRISDNTLWWEFANHDDMCGYHDQSLKVRKKNRRRGSFNLSIPTAIWGPYRYSYEDVGRHQTLIQLPEDDYAVILTLQKVFYGRTKVDKKKHIQSWSVDVDAPRGIPTHVDHSGGYKGDRTYGFGVSLPAIRKNLEFWETDAEAAIVDWVMKERLRTGFVRPDPVA